MMIFREGYGSEYRFKIYLEGAHRKELAMTEPEGTVQDAELDPESSTDEGAADSDKGAVEEPADYQKEAEETATDDYQARMEKFDEVDASVPVVSLPVKSSELDKSDLEV